MPYVYVPPGVSIVRNSLWADTYSVTETFEDGSSNKWTHVQTVPWAGVKRRMSQGIGPGWKPVNSYTRGAVKAIRSGSSVQTREKWNPWEAKTLVFDLSPFGGDSDLGSWVKHSENISFQGEPNWFSVNTGRRLNTELLVKLGDRKVNLGEQLAEARSAANTLAKTAKAVYTAYKAARRGNVSAMARALGVSPRSGGSTDPMKRWLEYEYAWKPMMQDMVANADLIKSGLNNPRALIKAVRNITESDSFEGETSNSRWVGSGTIRNTAKVFAKLSDDYTRRLHRVGLINPLEVAWAVVPYSFVSDWFLPIGSFLEALNARTGLTFVDGYYGRCVSGSASNSEIARESIPGKYSWESSFKVTTEWFGYERRIMGGFPMPSTYFKSPLSTSHTISAAALLKGVSSRRR